MGIHRADKDVGLDIIWRSEHNSADSQNDCQKKNSKVFTPLPFIYVE